jgi:voltage-gated potassium channel Kch
MTSPKRQISTSDKLRYAFDRSMAKGPAALIGWLGLVSLAFVGLAAIVLTVTGIKPEDSENLPFSEAAWQSAMRAIDAGALGGDSGWSYRFIMALVTIGGIFIVSSLIGVLTSGLEGKMDEMRKGRSFVIESDHTLILGWSSSIFTIISELVIANENQKAPRIVIMADKDKVEMEEEIRAKVGPTGRTRVVCRTGNPIDLYDLEIANPHESKAIIILSPEDDDPDSQVIKSVLAITNNPRRREQPYHIVAEIQNPENMEAAHLVGKGEAQFIQSNDLIARITVQTCRQSGMSVIYTELLDYGGDEIYFKEEPGLVGKTFGEALSAYEESALLGMQFKGGLVRVNPPIDTVIAAGDKLIAISEDDDTVVLSGHTSFDINESLIQTAHSGAAAPERTLILGWNSRGPAIIRELDSYVAPGSEVMVLAEVEEAQTEIEALVGSSRNQTLRFQLGNSSDRATLDSLEIPTYQHVIVLGYIGFLQPQQADARTLITLLHLRNIEQKSGQSLSIVSEMMDVGNRELAEVTQADDFIVSDNLISLLMAQVSENKHLNAVFNDLFDSEGSEIYLKPAGDYVAIGQSVSFYTVVEAARRRGESAIGYRVMAHASNSKEQYGVRVNPKKSGDVTFAAEDRIIVVAES